MAIDFSAAQPPADMRAELRRQVTAMRWQKETGGITVGGMPVNTGLDDQNRIASVLAVIALGMETVDFKISTGWVTLTAVEIQAVAKAVGTHVQACFSAERAHHAAIAKLDSAAAASYDVSSGWPVSAY
ncbi:DUF4376 domain-containing protein [Xanthomonas translucens]|uniref:DUF4376 domain-containing protein n=1 Tax=Xanthomonas campestris pv. translucens TaxID=343 RepID=UPI0009BE1702|nr:DUF4376 domain-containing protein [Xanthomonas translucens]